MGKRIVQKIHTCNLCRNTPEDGEVLYEMCGEFWCEKCCDKQDDCSHPRSERSYVGKNMLKCNICGFEFS